MTNEELKQKIKESNLYQWQVANAVGVSEMTLIRWFRSPITKEHG
jgi:DNA-binding XRE family transcriptional regulator